MENAQKLSNFVNLHCHTSWELNFQFSNPQQWKDNCLQNYTQNSYLNVNYTCNEHIVDHRCGFRCNELLYNSTCAFATPDKNSSPHKSTRQASLFAVRHTANDCLKVVHNRLHLHAVMQALEPDDKPRHLKFSKHV